MMLRAKLMRDGEVHGTWDVLNEIVITRGQQIRPIHVNAYVDSHFLASYVSDGVIASTPTGSTAYALAAGGPILPPELRNILLIAVAPHFSVDRAIVLAEGSQVMIELDKGYQAVMSPDGQMPIDFCQGDRINAFASPYSTKFVRFKDPGYFYRNITTQMSQNRTTENHHE
jgi:NAD+ kinase